MIQLIVTLLAVWGGIDILLRLVFQIGFLEGIACPFKHSRDQV